MRFPTARDPGHAVRGLALAAITVSLAAAAVVPAPASRQPPADRDHPGQLGPGQRPGGDGSVPVTGRHHVRVFLPWALIAPNAKQKSAPKHFNATDPSAYSAAKFAPYDAIVRAAQEYGLTVELVVTGGSPLWAEGAGVPRRPPPTRISRGSPTPPTMASSSRRSPSATRHLHAQGRVGFAAPDPLLVDLERAQLRRGPGAAGDRRLQRLLAPVMYRRLVNAGWDALQRTGHAKDTILIGEPGRDRSRSAPADQLLATGIAG